METESTATTAAEGDAPAPGDASKPGKSRPTETLPTDRIAFQKQLNLLISYAAIYEQTGQAVTNEQAGEIVGLSAGTTSLANAFFSDVGFLTRAEGGYVPSNEVIGYRRVQEWDPDAAPRELAPLLNGTWFAQALLPKLAIGPMSMQAALSELSKRANASTHYRLQLGTLIDYLTTAGVIAQEGDQLRRVGTRPPKDSKPEDKPAAPPKPDLHPFVQGLLQELPPPGTVWSKQAQQDWIAGWEVAFKFLYKTPEDRSDFADFAPQAGGGETD